jgi:hypothetical protein
MCPQLGIGGAYYIWDLRRDQIEIHYENKCLLGLHSNVSLIGNVRCDVIKLKFMSNTYIHTHAHYIKNGASDVINILEP